MINFTERKFIKFYLGSKAICSHIDAVHAKDEVFTGAIVKGIIKEINCSGIIATVFRTVADLNALPNNKNKGALYKEAWCEYTQAIRKILEHRDILDGSGKLTKHYLHIAIHGMKDRKDKDIEIGTQCGKTCQSKVRAWFVKNVTEKSKKTIGGNIKIDEDKYFCGITTSIGFHHQKYGDNFNTFQVEISKTLRKKHLKELIDIFSTIIIEFNKKF